MKAAAGNTQKRNSPDALTLLTEDHETVEKLFKAYAALKETDGNDSAERAALVNQICTKLTIHAQIEEDIFYPAARAAIEDAAVMDEAEVEHAGAKDLIAQLTAMAPDDDLYDAKLTVLREYITHHVKEEQDEMFPQIRKAKLDTSTLGAEMVQRKQELQAELGDTEADESKGATTNARRTPSRKTAARASK